MGLPRENEMPASPLDEAGPVLRARPTRDSVNDSDSPYGSLITMGRARPRKKPVLVVDADELDRAHREFEIGAAQIMDNDDAPPPPRAHVDFLGLAPMDGEELVVEADDSDSADDEWRPPAELLAGLIGDDGPESDEGESTEPSFGDVDFGGSDQPQSLGTGRTGKAVGIDLEALRKEFGDLEWEEESAPGDGNGAAALSGSAPQDEPEEHAVYEPGPEDRLGHLFGTASADFDDADDCDDSDNYEEDGLSAAADLLRRMHEESLSRSSSVDDQAEDPAEDAEASLLPEGQGHDEALPPREDDPEAASHPGPESEPEQEPVSRLEPEMEPEPEFDAPAAHAGADEQGDPAGDETFYDDVFHDAGVDEDGWHWTQGPKPRGRSAAIGVEARQSSLRARLMKQEQPVEEVRESALAKLWRWLTRRR